MSDEPDNLSLVYVRRLDAKMDRSIDDMADVKIRLTNLEGVRPSSFAAWIASRGASIGSNVAWTSST